MNNPTDDKDSSYDYEDHVYKTDYDKCIESESDTTNDVAKESDNE